MPRVSVICPAYNRGRELLHTVNSVRAQTFRDWELIVASDASDDDTDEVAAEVAAEDRRVRLLRTERFGFPAGPVNAALRGISGAYVAYLDHDDLWEPEHLATLVAVLDEGADWVAARSRKADARGRVTETLDPLTLCWHPEIQLMNPLFENSCALHRSELAEVVGGWRESGVGLEDWDLWLRLTDAGARCTTLLDRTVTLLHDPGTRQHSLPCAHEHEIARLPDPRAARAAYRALTHPRHFEAGYEAATADLLRWYGGLAERGELVFPRGWEGGAEALPEAVRRHVRAVAPVWNNLVIEPKDDHVALSMVLSTMTAEHARRYTDYFRSAMHSQMEFYEAVLPPGSVVR
ncbi:MULTISPECIES: glycosyltransferase [unclassified Streptomyces]|uniref:glycosyltransferase n=1 Tax=unclassified Streptomyces TaxID=2593676 RepID=UPI0022B6C609|nr:MULTISPECIES: glycosyltransferase [unclassified Streptomyces]MCZ7417061.1 glycosyltransferase [Streptomyces sp. WMMC897]MCZ7433111.1 glycosyltransferase [Streptomyces sp. WMMC1477]